MLKWNFKLTVVVSFCFVISNFAFAADVKILSHSNSSFKLKTGQYIVSYQPQQSNGVLAFYKDGDETKGYVSNLSFDWNKADIKANPVVTSEENNDIIKICVASSNDDAKYALTVTAFKKNPGLVNWTLSAKFLKGGKHFENTFAEMKFYDFSKSKFIDAPVTNYLEGTPGSWSSASRDDYWGGFAYFYDPNVLNSTVLYHEEFTAMNDYYSMVQKPMNQQQTLEFWKAYFGESSWEYQIQPNGQGPAASVKPRARTSWDDPTPKDSQIVPEWGYTIPKTETEFKADTEITLLNSFLYLSPGKSKNSAEYSDLFLKLFAKIYDHKEKPNLPYTDWAGDITPKMVNELLNDSSWVKIRNDRFIGSYATIQKHGGELNTLTALVNPLDTYVKKYNTEDSKQLLERLRKELPYFYDANFTNINGSKGLAGNGMAPYPKDFIIESWYFYIPLIDVGEFALKGDETAKKMFLGTMPIAIDIAHSLDYLFPKIFTVYTGKLYEKEPPRHMYDCTGSYIYLMIQYYELTKDKKFIDEAKKAAEKIKSMGFEYDYEMSTVGYSALGLLKLYELTGDRQYLDLSYIVIANVVHQSWMWQCKYGYLKDHVTFFTTSATPCNPLANGFEESILWLTLNQYLKMGENVLPDYVKKLVAEMLKYKNGGFRASIPALVPEEGICSYPFVEAKMDGKILKKSHIPLEAVALEWRQSGECGNAIYSAAGPIVMANELYNYFDGGNIQLYTEYPLLNSSFKNGKISFKAVGTSDYTYKAKLQFKNAKDRSVAIFEAGKKLKTAMLQNGCLDFTAKGGTNYELKID